MRAKITCLAMAGLLGLTACTEPSEFSSDPNKRTKEGAAVGAALGAIAGAIVGNDAEDILIGAAIGAGGGALVGADLDRQARELQASLGNQVVVRRVGDELIVTMPQDILFAFDSAQVSPGLTSDLKILAASLNNYADTTVEVIGHTDSDGEAGYNQRLSSERAQSVASILISEGVAPNRIRAFGRGEDEPVATNQTAEGRAQNRRVDIVIRPRG
ncbi:membrane protein [Actibacterium mucosum KCTC 23349]|uniref:Membrane protein n=1 Tax=Actibacterium mucosum KCTC 23349 TaxID=1454373 RepID=A0A037ZDV8_9RHOB|nr:OmpA family protein [Actibacterium mucosum]KAJ54679.1 membrane protein [Actibacterium mucosum KCTC 23349]